MAMLRKIYDRLGIIWANVVLTAVSIFVSISGTFLILSFLDASEETFGPGLTIAAIMPLIVAPLTLSIPLRLLLQLDRAEQEKAQLVKELQESITNIKTLKGLIPICASCKKIRDDEGFWQHLEVYIHDHSDAVLSHGYCPECAQQLYAEIAALKQAQL
jgi:hypothetical protein